MISSLLIKPAGADCNMACSYCFYRPTAGLYPGTPQPRMSAEVLRELVRQYMELAGSAQAAFCWQGGEPTLMGLDFYRQVVALQQKYGHPGQVVANSLQTNGLLINDEWARFLARYRFLIGLSLDGPPEVHDHYRVSLGGQPTQRQVVRAWRVLQQGHVETNILCMATAHSADKAPLILEYLYDLGARFMQFIPCLEQHPITGASLPVAVSPEAYGDFLCALFDAWRPYHREVSVRLFDDVVSRLVGREELVSCEFRPRCGDYLVVEHNGDLYTCDFFVDPQHQLGNLMALPLAEAAASADFAAFATAKGSCGAECGACEWLSFCQGGCPKHRLFAQQVGRDILDRPSGRPTVLCEAYKRFFAHALPALREIVAELPTPAATNETAAP